MRGIIITLIACTTIYYLWGMTLRYRAEIKKLERIQEIEDVKNWKYSG
ncbi:hypothetical protein [Sebaldella termitidis]